VLGIDFGHKLYLQPTSDFVGAIPRLLVQTGQFALEDLCSCQRPQICMDREFLLSSSLSRLTRSFTVKATKPRKPRSLSVVLDSSNTATRMVVSFCTCLFQRCQLGTPVSILAYVHFERVIPTRIQCSFHHLSPQDFFIDIDLGETIWERCKTYSQHIGNETYHG
jgi:hypothetical protein